jgi:hypothetical protein
VCHYAEWSIFYCYAECHHAECSGAKLVETSVIILNVIASTMCHKSAGLGETGVSLCRVEHFYCYA